MYKFRQAAKKFITFIALLAIMAQSASPYLYIVPQIAQAQEVDSTSSPQATPTVDQTTPTPIQDNSSTSLEPSVAPIDTITPVPTDVPTDTVTPTPADTVTPTDTQPVNNLSPPATQNDSSNPSPAPTSIETSNTTQDNSKEETLSAIILENVSAPSIDLDIVVSAGSATLTTDKTDYAPTDTALITGSNLTPNTTYSLTISSTDEPPTSTTVDVTSNENGTFVYAYQLDGNYRPNYKVELKDSTGTVIATTTFTDSPTCTTDAQGADDEPGQKDLTQMCNDYAGLPTSINIKWNWDDTSFSGANTGDACSLYDNDGDGLANYALCVGVNGTPTATWSYTKLYSCGDGSSERCTSTSTEITTLSSTCSASVGTGVTSPFNSGQDTIADCSVQMSDVGGASSVILDVCSYPSGQPNSDPSDCVLASTQPQTGTLTVVKDLVPSNDNGLFNLQVNSFPSTNNVGDGGTTGPKIVSTGNNAFNESAGTGTNLSNYTTTVACKDNGNNNSVSTTGSNPWTVNINNNQNVTCTITNSRLAGSVKVNKLVDSDGNGSYEGGNTEANTLGFTWSLDSAGTNSMGSTVSSVNTGTHSVNESSVTNYHFVGWYLTSDTSKTCLNTTNTTLPASISVSSGQTTEITLCNAVNTGTVVVHKDVQGPNGEALTDTSNNFTVQLDSANSQTITDNGTVTYNNVVVGIHTVTESAVATGYALYGISTTVGGSGDTSGLSINVTNGQTTDVYVTNRQNTGTITVVKDVRKPDGSDVSDTHSFTANVGTQSASFSEGNNAEFTVNPGTHTVTEDDDQDYDEQGCRLASGELATNFTVSPGGQVTVTCTNNQKQAKINVAKNVVAPDGTTDVSDSHAFTAQLNGGNDQSFSEATTAAFMVNPGDYSITELTDSNYDFVSCTPDANQTISDGAQVTVGSNDEITVTCVNKQKNAQVTVVKDVRDPNGSDVSDNTNFVVQRDGSGTDDKTFREGLNAVYTLVPGTYTFAELVTAGYTLNSVNPDNDADESNGTTITLNSGQNVTVTFTNYQNAGSISGQKFGDTDGVLGTTIDQSNLVNWVIELYTCTSSFTGCVFLTSDTTDSSGYSFLSLVPGYYQVKEVLQSGWTVLTSLFHNITVSPGENETGKNFVNFENVSVKACKKVDADGDISTTKDQTDKSDWEVTLLVDGQASGGAQLTGREDGCYTWSDLGPGHTYGVSEETPAGWTTLSDTTHSFGSAQGGSNYVYTFVNFENISISGHKWNDLNGDGVWDQGEPALENWDINLSGAASASDTTDSSGLYSFVNLGPGTYTLSETGQTGWTQTYPTNPSTHSVTAQSGVDVEDKDFGNQGRGSITVVKNVDTDGDGDVDDANVTDWTWDIDGSGDYDTGSTQGVGAGTYTVSEDQKTDYHVTSVACDDDEVSETISESAEVTVDPGQDVTCTFVNTRDTGSVKVNKEVDSDGDGQFEGGNTEANVLEFDWGLDAETPARNMGTIETPVLTGSHTVSESSVTDYSFVGWYLAGTDASCSNPETLESSNPAEIDVAYNETTEITLCNQRDTGTIEVIKEVESINEDDGLFDLQIDGNTEYEGAADGDSTGPITVLTGTHSVGEIAGEGTNLGDYVSEISCSNEDSTAGTLLEDIEVSSGGEIICTITNTRKGTVIVTKYNDLDGDGELDKGEEVLSGWDMHLSFEEGLSLDQTTGQNGIAPFNNLLPDFYRLSETAKPGWKLTNITCDSDSQDIRDEIFIAPTIDNSNDHGIEVGVGQTIHCSVFNQQENPILTITKENNTGGATLLPGSEVLYTITVTATQSAVKNVVVTDLLPDGFKFKVGSATKNGLPFTPSGYASPGVWDIGDMAKDETITLTYVATISNDQQLGLYKDVAWAEGQSLAGSTVLAIANDPGDLDTSDADSNFVGTQVNVDKTTTESVGLSVRREEVLGASTELPATGASNIWTLSALIMLILGLNLTIAGIIIRKRYV